MSPPERSYVIWFSQRVGSTMLTQALEDTGVAGRPREWLEDGSGAGLLAKYGVADVFALRDTLWRQGTTNGVFGAKHSPHADGQRAIAALLAPLARDGDERAAWEALFPRCRHVFMTRRNKLRLAVSWWRAIQSAEWHRPSRAALTAFDGPKGRAPRPEPPPDLVDRYDYGAIEHLMIEADLREADIQERLERWGITPHTIVYEDLIARYEPTLRALVEALEIPGGAGVVVPPPAFAQLADAVSDAWCERFLRERAAKQR